MKELIGTCRECGKEIYCLEGFFNGIHIKEKGMYCFKCYEEKDNIKNETPQS